MANMRVHGAETRARGANGFIEPEIDGRALRCAFSTVRTIKVGTGTTAKKQETRFLWLVEQRGEQYAVRKLNPSFVPVGDEEIIDTEKLLADYTPEVEIYNSRVEPAMKGLEEAITKGDEHREQHEPLSAEMEYDKALDIDEKNVRAIFGLGLVYLERDDRAKARGVFEDLVDLKGAFDSEHKHLFNEFGIALRKSLLFEEAVKYYSRAVEISTGDENLYYNLARAFYEKGDWDHCMQFLAHALEINSQLEQALNLCTLIVGVSDNPALLKKYDKPQVPGNVVQEASRWVGDTSSGGGGSGDDEDFGSMSLELPVGGLGNGGD